MGSTRQTEAGRLGARSITLLTERCAVGDSGSRPGPWGASHRGGTEGGRRAAGEELLVFVCLLAGWLAGFAALGVVACSLAGLPIRNSGSRSPCPDCGGGDLGRVAACSLTTRRLCWNSPKGERTGDAGCGGVLLGASVPGPFIIEAGPIVACLLTKWFPCWNSGRMAWPGDVDCGGEELRSASEMIDEHWEAQCAPPQ